MCEQIRLSVIGGNRRCGGVLALCDVGLEIREGQSY
ncbi:ABC transporter ATP-binding protein, partial [Burkholderia pseudomallei]